MEHPAPPNRPRDRETGLADEEETAEEEPKPPAAPPANVEPMTDMEPPPDVAAERAETWSDAPAGG